MAVRTARGARWTGATTTIAAVALALAACGGDPAAVDLEVEPQVAPPLAAPAAPVADAAVVGGATIYPAFRSSIDPVTANDLPSSWRPGCPVGPESLRRVEVTHWGFDGLEHQGVLIVHADHARGIVDVFSLLFGAGFQVERMQPIDVYGGSDDASMAANNTSAFNCRAVTGGTSWSEHSFGWAIDVNPVQNPYVRGTTVLPPAGRDHLLRTPGQGRIIAGDVTVSSFASIGWSWGGAWSSPIDYQHFSATNR